MKTVVIRCTKLDGTSPLVIGSKEPIHMPQAGLFNPGVPWWACWKLQDALDWFGRDASAFRWHLVICDEACISKHLKSQVVVNGPGLVVWSGLLRDLEDLIQYLAPGARLRTLARRHKAWVHTRRFAMRRAEAMGFA